MDRVFAAAFNYQVRTTEPGMWSVLRDEDKKQERDGTYDILGLLQVLQSSRRPRLRTSEMQLPQERIKWNLYGKIQLEFLENLILLHMYCEDEFKREQAARIVNLSVETVTDYTNFYQEVFFTIAP